MSWLKLYTVVKIYDRQFMSIEAAKATANAGGQGGGGLSLVAAGGVDHGVEVNFRLPALCVGPSARTKALLASGKEAAAAAPAVAAMN